MASASDWNPLPFGSVSTTSARALRTSTALATATLYTGKITGATALSDGIAMALIVRQRDPAPERTEDYEAVLAPLYAWIHAIAQTGGQNLGPRAPGSHGTSERAWGALAGARRGGLRRRALAAAFPLVIGVLNRAREYLQIRCAR